MTKLLKSDPAADADVRIAGPVARKLLGVGMDSVDVFFLALVAGDIAPGVMLANALSCDVFALYRTWCARHGCQPRWVRLDQTKELINELRSDRYPDMGSGAARRTAAKRR